jgi:cation-transporting ATPase 13A1
VHGIVVDTPSGKIINNLNEAITVKPQVSFVMGGCHTVVQHEGQLLGDPIEKLFFDSSSWKYNHSLKMSFNSKKNSQNVTIKFTHPFRSDLKRMSAVCKAEGFDTHDGSYALVKGAPEIVGALLKSKPDNYDEVAFKLMKDGYRVLALACRKLQSYNNMIVEREELEKDLDFVGLLVLNCPMKKDTPHYIKILKNANYHNIMITGDNMFTAAKTGQDLDFGPSKHNLYLKKTGAKEFEWFDVEDKPFQKLKLENLAKLAKEHTLCLEGTEMGQVFEMDKALFTELMVHTVIFARVSPDQKELIVKELKEKGLKVLMCGDGTNDVGALKKSDVGIALVGIKEEPDEAVVKAERDEKQKQMQEAIRTRNFALIKELNQPLKDEGTEFKSGDACIAAPFTNKYTNSLKCGRVGLTSHHHRQTRNLHHVHHDPNLPNSDSAVTHLRLHDEYAPS